MNDSPTLSVVVAAFSGEAALRRCLASIVPQAGMAEVLVATAADDATVARVQNEFPAARYLRAAPDTGVFGLRSLAIAAARAPIIALTEDHCVVSPGWLTALSDAFADGHVVAGGPVENGLARPRDWALFLCEYAALLPPLAEGPNDALLGVNIAYARAALDSCRDTWAKEFHESEVHAALRRNGYSLHCVPRARVSGHLQMPLAQAARHLYRGGRRFGHYRQGRASAVQRGLWLAVAPLVPCLLLFRMVRTVARRQPGRLVMLLRAAPYLVCLIGAWSAGETAGYLAGLGPTAPSSTREAANAAGRRNVE